MFVFLLLLLPFAARASPLEEALYAATARSERAMALVALCDAAPAGEEDYLCGMAAKEFKLAAAKTTLAVRLWLQGHLCHMAARHPGVEGVECGMDRSEAMPQ